MARERFPVLLTGVGGGGHGEQILKALRLGALEYYVVGTDMSQTSAGRARVDAFEVLPPASHPEYIDATLALARRYAVRAIFHGSEPEMRRLADAHQRFGQHGIYVPVNSPELLAICQDKCRTMSFLAERGFRTPQTAEIRSQSDLSRFETLPAVLKPSVGGGGSMNVYVAQTREELLALGGYLLSLYERILVQEYVGTAHGEFTIGVLFGADGALLNSIAIKRVISNALSVRLRVPNRSARAELGPELTISSGVSQGMVGGWKALTRKCEVIAASLGPRAPINIQCRVVDDEVVPFEINPRFSGTTSLRAMVGYNEPDILVRRDVLGEKIEPHFAYREAIIMRGLAEYELSACQ